MRKRCGRDTACSSPRHSRSWLDGRAALCEAVQFVHESIYLRIGVLDARFDCRFSELYHHTLRHNNHVPELAEVLVKRESIS